MEKNNGLLSKNEVSSLEELIKRAVSVADVTGEAPGSISYKVEKYKVGRGSPVKLNYFFVSYDFNDSYIEQDRTKVSGEEVIEKATDDIKYYLGKLEKPYSLILKEREGNKQRVAIVK